MSAVAVAPEQRWPGCVAAMDALADDLLDTLPANGMQEARVADALIRAFPSVGDVRCWNRAAIAVARYQKIQRDRQDGIAREMAELRRKGKPEEWAYHNQTAQEPAKPPSPPAATTPAKKRKRVEI